MKLTIKTKNHNIDTSFINYEDLTVIDENTVELEIEKELSANEEQKLNTQDDVISYSYEVTEMDTDEVIQKELDKQVVREISVENVDEDENFICILSDSVTELHDYKNKKLEKIYVNEEDIVYREIKDNKIIIFNDYSIIFGIGNTLEDAVADMKNWIDDEINIDDIQPNYRNCEQAPNEKFVYNECSEELYLRVQEHGGDCGFEINKNGLAVSIEK